MENVITVSKDNWDYNRNLYPELQKYSSFEDFASNNSNRAASNPYYKQQKSTRTETIPEVVYNVLNNPRSSYDWKSLGDLYLQKNMKTEAVSAYTKALIINPHDYSCFHQRKKVYENEMQSINLQKPAADDWVRFGQLQESMHDPQKAYDAYKNALTIDKGNVDAHLKGTALAIMLGKNSNAEQLLIHAQKVAPNNPEVQNMQGNYNYKLHNYQNALAAYEKAMKLDPENSLYRTNLLSAKKMILTDKYETGQLTTSTQLNDAGMVHYNLGEYQAASNFFTKAIELSPANNQLYNNRAAAYIGAKQLDLAQSDLSTVLESRPNDPVAQNNMGMLKMHIADYPAASKCLARATELSPGNPIVSFNTGMNYHHRGLNDYAANNFSQALNKAGGFRAANCDNSVGYLLDLDAQRALAQVEDPRNIYSQRLMEQQAVDFADKYISVVTAVGDGLTASSLKRGMAVAVGKIVQEFTDKNSVANAVGYGVETVCSNYERMADIVQRYVNVVATYGDKRPQIQAGADMVDRGMDLALPLTESKPDYATYAKNLTSILWDSFVKGQKFDPQAAIDKSSISVTSFTGDNIHSVNSVVFANKQYDPINQVYTTSTRTFATVTTGAPTQNMAELQRRNDQLWETGAYDKKGNDNYWASGAYKKEAYYQEIEKMDKGLGGVAMNPHVLANIGNIEGLVYDEKTGNLVLVGDGNLTLPPLKASQLAWALDYVTHYSDQQQLGFSIEAKDPTKRMSDQYCLYIPSSVEYTPFGDIAFRTDWKMKQYAMGLSFTNNDWTNPANKIQRTSNVPGYRNQMQRRADLPRLLPEGRARLWLDMDDIVLEKEDNTVALKSAKMRVQARNTFYNPATGNVEDQSSDSDSIPIQFAQWFEDRYDDIANEASDYKELRELGKIVGLAKWIRDQKIPIDTTWWAKNMDYSIETQSTLPCLQNKMKAQKMLGAQQITTWSNPAVGIISQDTTYVPSIVEYTVEGGVDFNFGYTVEPTIPPESKAIKFEKEVTKCLETAASASPVFTFKTDVGGWKHTGVILPITAAGQKLWANYSKK